MKKPSILNLILAALLFVGISGHATYFTEPKTVNVDLSKHYFATIETEKGDIKCELYPEYAPLSVTNFVQLAKGGFYNGLTFHRVVPNFVIQGGDPTGTGAGGPGYTIPAEISNNPLKHERGALAWARTDDRINPYKRSSGSQFYITHTKVAFLDGNYTVFGKVVEGMGVVDKIHQGDKIISVTIDE